MVLVNINDFSDVIGLVGGFCVVFCLVPQILKTVRTRSAKDISLLWQCTYIFGLILVLIYSIYKRLFPIYFPGILEIIIAITFLVLKLKYDREGENEVV